MSCLRQYLRQLMGLYGERNTHTQCMKSCIFHFIRKKILKNQISQKKSYFYLFFFICYSVHVCKSLYIQSGEDKILRTGNCNIYCLPSLGRVQASDRLRVFRT